MASFATNAAGMITTQDMAGLPPQQGQQQQQQQQQQQLSPQQQQLSQHHNLQQQQFVQTGGGSSATDLSPAARSASSPNSNALNLGLGFLRGLGLERKTNRDGQPPKRRGPKPDSKPALTRRQELNRQAQRTHRQRKEVYIKSLEDQVMQLKELYALQVQERGAVDEENRKLRELLSMHGIQLAGDVPQQMAQQHHLSSDGFPSNFSVSDGGLGPGTSDYATPSSYHASGSESNGPAGPGSALSAPSDGTLHQGLLLQQQQQQQQHLHHHHQQYQQQQQQQLVHPNQQLADQLLQGNAEENQLGIDFVLASVTPSSFRQVGGIIGSSSSSARGGSLSPTGPYLCVRSAQSVESSEPVASGHALMLSCPPASHIEENPSEQYPHRAPMLPTASLTSLLNSARHLPGVGDGEVTPIMALNMIQTDARYGQMAVREFNAVQKELEEKTRCYGFGAVLEEFEVRDALENVFSSRNTTGN